MSYADKIFAENCLDIINNGYMDSELEVRPRWEDGTPAHTIKKFGVVNRYDLSKEFPILTLRCTAFKSCIDEILWIWQKKSNKVSELNSHIWDSWADENGTIGKAYGYQLGVKHKYKEGLFDQVDRMLFDLKNNPSSRRIMSNIYVHNDLSEMGLYPCAYSLTLNVSGNVLNGILNQRSQDMLVANNWNVCQYAVLMHMFAQSSGLKVGELVHVIADAHIYDRHIPIVKEILNNPMYDAPEFKIDTSINDFYKFTVDSFSLDGYVSTKLEQKIPVAI
jgi:thymidylate synthase